MLLIASPPPYPRVCTLWAWCVDFEAGGPARLFEQSVDARVEAYNIPDSSLAFDGGARLVEHMSK